MAFSRLQTICLVSNGVKKTAAATSSACLFICLGHLLYLGKPWIGDLLNLRF